MWAILEYTHYIAGEQVHSLEDSLTKHSYHVIQQLYFWVFTQRSWKLCLHKNTDIHFQLHREDPLEEGIAIHSSIFAWRIPTNREAWQATVHRVTKSQT